MKTVMKKMLSLMLVAVLLVGVMPFQAFADGENGSTPQYTVEFQIQYPDGRLDVHSQPSNGATFNAQAALDCYAGDWSSTYEIDQVWMDGQQVAQDSFTHANENCALGVVLKTKHVHSYSDATCTTPATCSCGATNGGVDSTKHSYGEWTVTTPGTCSTKSTETRVCSLNATHTETRDGDFDYNVHNFVNNKCSDCGACKFCGDIGSHPENCLYYCNGATNCPNDPTVKTAHNEGCLKTKCNKNGCTKDYGHTDECSVPCTKTEGCVLKQNHTGDCNTPCTFTGCTLGYKHSGDHSNACATCGLAKIKSPEHNSNCAYYYVSSGETVPSGSHSLKVWARIWVHETKFETRLLDTIDGLSGDAKIYQVIAANKDRLNAKLPYDEFLALHWSETVNYLNDNNVYKDVGTNMTVSDEDDVYVNLYSAEQLIVVNVHTSKSYGYDLSVRIEGFRPGDTVTYNDVLKAVKKYYNVSSMSIYTYEEMCKMLDGKDANKTTSFIAGDHDPYEVFINGSRKSGSYTYTADSSNPKTGDMIFAPAIVLGASVTCLAVLFYLNKKRAF